VAHHEAHGRQGLTATDDTTPPGATPQDGEDAEALRRGAALFARPCVFTAAAATAEALPAPGPPEVAFLGRSNVGKSSLLNALTGRRDLARTSQTPGRTQTINFFDLDGRLTLVDLPGYGHADAAAHAIRAWTELIEHYLRERPTLRRVLLLIDARRGLMASDVEVMDWLDLQAVVYQAVLTKADAVKPGALAQRTAAVAEALGRRPAAFPVIVATSARAGDGIESLRASIAAMVEDPVLP
jgi:GTP-binding protein